MPDEASQTAATGAGLDDLERRLASFESATKRLGRTVGGISEAAALSSGAVGHASPPRRATRRFDEPDHEEISGLRPAVAAQGTQTGALMARNRGGGATPGFTSAYGKPAIQLGTRSVAAPGPGTPVVRPSIWRSFTIQQRLALGVGAALLLLLVFLPRLFPVLPDAAVWAEEQSVRATSSGTVETMQVRVGDMVTAGQVLAKIDSADQPSPFAGTVARLLTSTGARIAAGEPLAVVALPATRRVIVVLPPGLTPGVGDRARIELLGEGRMIEGAIELVLAAGEPGPWTGPGVPPNRAVLLPAPAPVPPRLGQGARVVLMGAPTPGRQLLAALRRMLPW